MGDLSLSMIERIKNSNYPRVLLTRQTLPIPKEGNGSSNRDGVNKEEIEKLPEMELRKRRSNGLAQVQTRPPVKKGRGKPGGRKEGTKGKELNKIKANQKRKMEEEMNRDDFLVKEVEFKNPVTKADFLRELGLAPMKEIKTEPEMPPPKVPRVAKQSPAKETTELRRSGRKTTAKDKSLKMFTAHPLPWSSERGRKVIEENKEALQYIEPGRQQRFERFCNNIADVYKVPPDTTVPVKTRKKSRIAPGDYVHTYTYKNRQKRLRCAELVVGCSSKSFKNLNKVHVECSVSLSRVSEETVKEIRERDAKKMADLAKKMENCRIFLFACDDPGAPIDKKLKKTDVKVLWKFLAKVEADNNESRDSDSDEEDDLFVPTSEQMKLRNRPL